jgi:hypothetical protein
MGFYEDDRIRRKNARFNVAPPKVYSLVISESILDKALKILADGGLTVTLRDKALTISEEN